MHVFTDSVYLRKGITEWLPTWKGNGWRTREKKPVKNADLWLRLDAATQRHHVEWFWVKGHAGHPENERADELACQGAEEAAAQVIDNEWGPRANEIYGGILSGARQEPQDRRPG